jgi:hypothetical protein
MKTRMTTDQRQTLRDYIVRVGNQTKPELLSLLPRLDDFELLATTLLAGFFDDKSPVETIEFLASLGIYSTDIRKVLSAVIECSIYAPPHKGWN